MTEAQATTAPKKAPAKKAAATKKPRVRRTKAQIEADNAAEAKRREELAAERAAAIPTPRRPKFKKTFHFLEDGQTYFGQQWYRGQEVTIVEGSKEFSLAFDREGRFILDLTPEEQIAKWGKVMYAEGPWPYKGYDTSMVQKNQDGRDIELTPAEVMALEKANKARKLEG